MKALLQHARAFLRSQEGPTATEYAILLAVICGAAFAALATFGDGVGALYTTLVAAVDHIS